MDVAVAKMGQKTAHENLDNLQNHNHHFYSLHPGEFLRLGDGIIPRYYSLLMVSVPKMLFTIISKIVSSIDTVSTSYINWSTATHLVRYVPP